ALGMCQRLKTRYFSGRSSWCWKRSTSRTFWTARMASGQVGRRTRRWGHCGRISCTSGVAGFWTWTSGNSSSAHVDALLKTQLLDLTSPELLEQGDRFGLVGEQVQVRCGVPGDLNCAIVDLMIDPPGLDAQAFGELRDRPMSGNVPWVRLTALAEQPMTQAN